MHFLFVVYVCILQCHLFEFRTIRGPFEHVHQAAPHHGLRVARSAHPPTFLITPNPADNSIAKPTVVLLEPSSTGELMTTSEPCQINFKETTTDESLAMVTSQIENSIPVKEITTNNTEIFIENPQPVNDETLTPTAPLNNAEFSNIQTEQENEAPTPNNEDKQIADTNSDDITKQQFGLVAEDKLLTPTNILHKSTSDNAPVTYENEESSSYTASPEDQQAALSNGSEHVQTVPMKQEACEECTMALESGVEQGKENIPADRI